MKSRGENRRQISDYYENKQAILVGNGINLLKENISWEDLLTFIRNNFFVFNCEYFSKILKYKRIIYMKNQSYGCNNFSEWWRSIKFLP